MSTLSLRITRPSSRNPTIQAGQTHNRSIHTSINDFGFCHGLSLTNSWSNGRQSHYWTVPTLQLLWLFPWNLCCTFHFSLLSSLALTISVFSQPSVCCVPITELAFHHDMSTSFQSFSFLESGFLQALPPFFLWAVHPQLYCSDSHTSSILKQQNDCLKTRSFSCCRHNTAIYSNVFKEHNYHALYYQPYLSDPPVRNLHFCGSLLVSAFTRVSRAEHGDECINCTANHYQLHWTVASAQF